MSVHRSVNTLSSETKSGSATFDKNILKMIYYRTIFETNFFDALNTWRTHCYIINVNVRIYFCKINEYIQYPPLIYFLKHILVATLHLITPQISIITGASTTPI